MKTEPNDLINPTIETVERAGETWFADTFSTGGLTKREYFAAMAMQGILARGDIKPNETLDLTGYSVNCADKLIEALNNINP